MELWPNPWNEFKAPMLISVEEHFSFHFESNAALLFHSLFVIGFGFDLLRQGFEKFLLRKNEDDNEVFGIYSHRQVHITYEIFSEACLVVSTKKLNTAFPTGL